MPDELIRNTPANIVLYGASPPQCLVCNGVEFWLFSGLSIHVGGLNEPIVGVWICVACVEPDALMRR